MDVNDLLSKLMMAGIISGTKEAEVKQEKSENKPVLPSCSSETRNNKEVEAKVETPELTNDAKDENLTEASL